jgi:hypothetical protein
MAREYEGYRDTLELICKAYPNRGLLQQKEVAEFLNLDPCTVKKHYRIKGRITPVDLARILSGVTYGR